MNNKYLISGMFRSGTTMLARMLHSNPYLICASDPFAPIFKSYRNLFSKNLLPSYDPDAPLHDYYFDRDQNRLFHEVQNSDFEESISIQEVKDLREKIEIHCLPYSPKIKPFLCDLKGETYKDILKNAFKIILKAYDKKEVEAVGFKEVWIDEFAPLFQNINANTKIIHLIRDPRSVVASNFVSGSTYPLLFLIRQWRKMATLAYSNALDKKNVKLIQFEKLLTDPESEAVNICRLLEVKYHTNMIDPSLFTDGAGQAWRQNTSYKNNEDKNKSKFNLSSLNNWEKVLSENVLRLIEVLCCKEMKMLGYNPVSDINKSIKNSEILEYNEEVATYAKWIRPFVNYNYFKELSVELNRINLIDSNSVLSEESKKLLVLKPKLFELIKKQ